MADEKIFKLSKDECDTLEHLANILHLFHHRNKNQHRRSIWWRHFSIFRRQLNALLNEVSNLNEIPSTHLQRTRKKVKDRETQTKISGRLSFWQDVLIPKWQHSFSQVTADGRFAVLGLVLTAVLAQTCHIVGFTTTLEDLGQAEVEKVLHEFGKEDWEGKTALEQGGCHEGEDVGEVIVRDDLPQDERSNESIVSAKQQKEGSRKLETKKSKTSTGPIRKKRKKDNAIDDLFSGLD